MGMIIGTLGDDLTAELPASLQLLLEKLKNEITRVFAVKALSRIAVSRLTVDISPILADSIRELATFLRKVTLLFVFYPFCINMIRHIEQQAVEAIFVDRIGRLSTQIRRQFPCA